MIFMNICIFVSFRTLLALDVYVRQGFLEIIYFPLSGDQPNEKRAQKLYFMKNFESHVRHENVAHHDCFYRSIYDYKFISPIGKLRWDKKKKEFCTASFAISL